MPTTCNPLVSKSRERERGPATCTTFPIDFALRFPFVFWHPPFAKFFSTQSVVSYILLKHGCLGKHRFPCSSWGRWRCNRFQIHIFSDTWLVPSSHLRLIPLETSAGIAPAGKEGREVTRAIRVEYCGLKTTRRNTMMSIVPCSGRNRAKLR